MLRARNSDLSHGASSPRLSLPRAGWPFYFPSTLPSPLHHLRRRQPQQHIRDHPRLVLSAFPANVYQRSNRSRSQPVKAGSQVVNVRNHRKRNALNGVSSAVGNKLINVSRMCPRLRVRNRRKLAAHQSRYVPDPQSSVDDRSRTRGLCPDSEHFTRN